MYRNTVKIAKRDTKIRRIFSLLKKRASEEKSCFFHLIIIGKAVLNMTNKKQTIY
jgi:hypothetical protein